MNIFEAEKLAVKLVEEAEKRGKLKEDHFATMALLAPSLKGLQTLPSAPERYCKKWDVNHVMLNAKKEKSKNMCFGKKQNLCCLHLDGKTIGILRNHSESSHEFPLLHQRESPIILPVCQWHTKDQGSF